MTHFLALEDSLFRCNCVIPSACMRYAFVSLHEPLPVSIRTIRQTHRPSRLQVRSAMRSNILKFLVAISYVVTVEAHGSLVHPRSRNSIDFDEVNCDQHTDHCSAPGKGNGCVNYSHPTEPCFNGQASFWCVYCAVLAREIRSDSFESYVGVS